MGSSIVEYRSAGKAFTETASRRICITTSRSTLKASRSDTAIRSSGRRRSGNPARRREPDVGYGEESIREPAVLRQRCLSLGSDPPLRQTEAHWLGHPGALVQALDINNNAIMFSP